MRRVISPFAAYFPGGRGRGEVRSSLSVAEVRFMLLFSARISGYSAYYSGSAAVNSYFFAESFLSDDFQGDSTDRSIVWRGDEGAFFGVWPLVAGVMCDLIGAMPCEGL